MKVKGILLAILSVMILSCGTRKTINKDELVGTLNDYTTKVDGNTALKQAVSDGVLTDLQGAEDIGTYKIYVDYDKQTGDLVHIRNVEKTGNLRDENYYFKDNALVVAIVKSSVAKAKRIYLNKGKIISSSNIDSKEEDLLLTKAKRFQTEYKDN
ncbi:hypothetical protein BN863_33140 [Formosa agariphila KMM 3901]|uniref:Lipoprotein n=1 Tax=Formosa agariphila (strain DSM 15362 / KCTC 12365 / LMG 23005 / KMM 3901 / M-2Alg 35-1) TaxID=1347342 RepID=T2KRE5_FORAG|nr:hypothetical protein [Formosa agariphila]CDF81026.1 hypothetical protein BN863_33140 [Formosa agariphila KMM 3901]